MPTPLTFASRGATRLEVFRVWGALEGSGLEGWHVWVIFGIGLFILEMIIPGFLVACFGVGCLASALVAALDGSFSWQLVAFAVGTLIVYFTIRPLFLKHFYSKTGQVRTNVHALVGQAGVVIHALDPDSKAGRGTTPLLAGSAQDERRRNATTSFDNCPASCWKDGDTRGLRRGSGGLRRWKCGIAG